MRRPLSAHLNAILAIVRKDARELLPLVLLACVVFFIQPVFVAMNFEYEPEFWRLLQTNFYWIGYFLGCLLMISVLQQDPAASLNHDWLTRPIDRLDWLLAKLAFLVLTVVMPVILSRFLVTILNDYGVGLSLAYALGLEKLFGPLAVPLLFAMALLAPTLRKFIFLLLLVLMLFLLPGWSVTRPLLEMLGVELTGSEFGGMAWVQALPVVVTGITGSLLIYWLYYCRREQRRAYAVFCISAAMVFFTVYPPAGVFNWDRIIALHKTMINTDEVALDDTVILEHTLACFPAVAGDRADNADQEESLLGRANWVDRFRRLSEAGGITFATTVSARNMPVAWFKPAGSKREFPVEWRLEHIRTRARFTSDLLDKAVAPIPSQSAVNRYAPVSATETDYWLIPPDVVPTLAADSSTRLAIDYDLALLSPKSYEIKTDGQRYEFPELGSCRAQFDNNENTVEIECLKRGARPELVSAQYIGLDSSRVDSASRSVFTPDWLEAFGRTHYQLTLQSPDLVDSSSVLLTAYNVERIVKKELVSPGVLGDSRDICPLPGDEAFNAIERSNWSDKSPHETSSVAVERGVRVEVLDWRGGNIKDAPTLFLLPGLGATAHSYDEVAPKLAEKYNVVGMTRRGAGDSSKPDHGYDTARLSQDVLAVMETLEIESPILVGMSIAGEELSYLGAHYPERFSGLVYLDAAYDRTVPASINQRYRELSQLLPPSPPVRPSELTSYEALAQYALRRSRPRNIPEGEIMASYDLATGTVKHDSLYLDAVMVGLQAPDYKNITVPALGIYAMPGSAGFMMEPWYDQDDPQLREIVRELYQMDRQGKEQQISRFDTEVPDSDVLILENGYHWVFLAHEREIIAAIDRFIENLQSR